MSEHLVSIAVAVYNGSKYIDDCVRCILDQTYGNYEVLFVVDSKTTDDSIDKLDASIDRFKDARIIIQNDSNRLSGARNIGIRESKGDVLWFLDVDDIAYPTFLEELLGIMDDHDSDVVCCNILMSKERTIKEFDIEYSVKERTGLEAVNEFTSLPVYSWSRIQKKRIFDSGDAMFIPYPSAEDIEQTVRTFAAANKVCYYNKPLYLYYKNDQSLTKNHRSTEAKAINDIARSSFDFIRTKYPDDCDGFKKRILERVMRQMAFVSYRDYSKAYKESVAHELLKDIKDKTMEMKVFSFSKLMYYCILYPFTHHFWDEKTGLWDKIS